jgi:hypothetical protein
VIGTGTRIERPKFQDVGGQWRGAVSLPKQVTGLMGDAALDPLIERGLTVRRFTAIVAAR